ncbi:hypothetical protein QQF64_036174 [Cirrhinus molitorella]|uniref:SPRY-associated domain-containing protein n=1 Tax=Cirrhinus molitorella TaxID=172907 RepID=A0ABR3NHU3_9TELE
MACHTPTSVDHGGESRITAGLKKYACFLTLDPNTANTELILSEDNRKVMTRSSCTRCRPSAPRTRSSQMSFTLAPGHHGPWVQQQRKTRARPRTRTSPPPPPPVFEISTRNRFAPLRETERNAVIVGDSIVRYPQS